MSQTKDFMPDGAYYDMVKEYLFQTGAIKTCPIHGNILIDSGFDTDDLYAMVTDTYNKDYGDELPVSYDAFHEIVQDIMRSTFDDCPECHHAME